MEKWFSAFISSFCLISFAMCGLAAALPKQQLLQDEVEALKEIGKKLGKKDLDFVKDPCSGEGSWAAEKMKSFESSVDCDCSVDHNTTCRIVKMSMKGQNLTGVIPQEFVRLRYLKSLDLSRNCLNGSVPLQWANLSLSELYLMGNKLSGPFPIVITRMTSLVNLILSSNALTGELPEELGMLTKIVDLRISDNNFTGKILYFISHWKQAEKLHMMGCSLQGPIPSSISALMNLIDLRITDLKGEESPFPKVSNMKSIKILILRNCLIQGKIPEFIGNLEKLKTLDLSFNNLTGQIPASFSNLVKVDFMYLTGNRLTRKIPPWVLSRNKIVDFSYNNFTWDNSSPKECPRGSVNLVESYSSSTTQS